MAPPPPYGIIANGLRRGKVVPFLGAGASFVGRPPGIIWDPLNPAFLPSGAELAEFLANLAQYPSTDPNDRRDLSKVCSYFTDFGGRPALRDTLRDLLNHPYPSGTLHEFLAKIPTPLVIVVTNYDCLLEQAFKAVGKPYDLIVYPADRKDIANALLWWPHGESEPLVRAANELDQDIDLGKIQHTLIFKMHGTIADSTQQWDNFVITEEDYVEFLSRMTTSTAVPAMFFPYFRERSFLFLGYSLRDWNLRVVLRNLSLHISYDETLPSWAIQYRPSELDQTLWTRRRVQIYDLTVDEFVAKMQEFWRV
jgi:SIR2-like protein